MLIVFTCLFSENKFLPIVEDKFIPVDMTEYLNRLDGDIRSCVQDLQNEKWVLKYENLQKSVKWQQQFRRL